MGEVYRAHDSVLERDVAVKVLPEDFFTDPERLARFKREAKVLAALNHSHIGAIYGMEEDEERHFLVLELIDGESLAERIARGRVPVAEVIPVAIQIAQALEAAHEEGIIHRDLKPANIMLTPDGEVKLLDFGLAKPGQAVFQGDLDASPTLTYAPTEAGVLLGTAAYMSPEQVRGLEVDKRSDIWAFGVVLWEMLTGKRLFQGDTVSDVVASTLTREPDWEALPSGLPPGVRRVLRRCLVSDPKARLHDIADARIELHEASETPEIETATPTVPAPPWRRALPWLAVPLALAGGWFWRPSPEGEPSPTVRFEMPVPEGERVLHLFRHGLALSPDGKSLAYVVGKLSADWPTEPTHQLYLQRFDRWRPRPMAGTEMGLQPIFSPDGKSLAFIKRAPRQLLKAEIDGGQIQTLCECDASFGASWGPDGTIVFAAARGPLQQISSTGGEPTPLTRLDEAVGESGHRLPHVLPDGSAVIFTVVHHYRDWESSEIVAFSPSSGERKFLVRGGSDGRFVPPGFLVFAREGRLLAVRFDPNRLEVYGKTVPVIESVNHSIYTGSSSWRTGVANLTVSATGSIAYLAGSVFPETPRGLALVDREGQLVEAIPVEPKQYLATRVSEDGRRALLATHYAPDDVWLFDFDRGTLSRQTFEGSHGWAIWGPGTDEFTVTAYQNGQWQVYAKEVGSGPGARRVLWEGSRHVRVASWSPDGKRLVATSLKTPDDPADQDLLILSADGDLAPFLETEYWEAFPDFSPDGRWIAYLSTESGRGEVYVRPFPGPGTAVQVSTEGGWEPAWSRDGRELYYRSDTPTPQFLAVKVDPTGDRFVAERPVGLFMNTSFSPSPLRAYDVTPDGKFLTITDSKDALVSNVKEFQPDRIRVVQNFAAELERNLPRTQRE